MKLMEEQIEHRLSEMEGWKRDEVKWITKKYRFPAFIDAVAFVNQVAQISEQLNHHPFISIEYRMVTLRMTSWNAGGLTELDFKAAAQFDEEYDRKR